MKYYENPKRDVPAFLRLDPTRDTFYDDVAPADKPLPTTESSEREARELSDKELRAALGASPGGVFFVPGPPDVKAMHLPADPATRKGMPLTTGVLDYFPLALAEVARVSKAGNDQHNPGQPLHWDKTKSLDHADCIGRHLIDRGAVDADGMRHSAKLAWRALALLQTELENAT